MEQNNLTAKSKIVLAAMLSITVLFCFFMLTNSGIISGVDLATDKLKGSSISQAYRATVIEGDIIDSNGDLITSASEVGKGGYCLHPSYSYLVGYNSAQYGTYGLRGRYEKYLYMGTKDSKGATLKLTTVNDLQDFAHEVISDIDGSAIVLDADTGRILALASYSHVAFDVNSLSSKMNDYLNYDGFFYANGYRDHEAPGSVFKIVTATAILENGMENDRYYDDGSEVYGGSVIHNASDASYGEVTLKKAFAKSLNTYFSRMAVTLGGNAISDKASDFLIGESVALDFTTLTSSFDLGDGNETLLAQTGFGQGHTQITPLHLAMIAQSVSNDGVMLRPYLIDSITLDGRVLQKGRTEKLSKTMSKDTSSQLKEIMNHTAVNQYGISETKYGYICAKTGTAELSNGKYHSYFVSFNDEYVVVISANNTTRHGSELKKYAIRIYDRLSQLQ